MMKVMEWWKLSSDEIAKEVMAGDVSPLAMFLFFPWTLLENHNHCNLLPSCCTCLWNIRKDSFIVLKLQMSQTYLTPSCSLSLCNIRSEILVALYPQMSQSSVPFAFISLELTLVIWKFPYFSKLNWEHFFYISKLFLAPGVCVWSDIIISI